jgi:hypothetical protein
MAVSRRKPYVGHRAATRRIVRRSRSSSPGAASWQTPLRGQPVARQTSRTGYSSASVRTIWRRTSGAWIGGYWFVLGVACCRAGAWKAANAAMGKRMEFLARPDESFNSFFLAMAHWQLGEKEVARHWYDRAVTWMEKQPQNDDLKRFRAEAEALLGPGDLPADVFASP